MVTRNCTAGDHACIPAACPNPDGGTVTIPREALQNLIWCMGQTIRRLETHADVRHPSAVDLAVIASGRIAMVNAAAALRPAEPPATDREGGSS